MREIRWQIQFCSLEGLNCVINIYDEGWNGGITQLTAASDPFEYSEDESNDLLKFVRHKTGYIKIIADNIETINSIRPTSIHSRFVEAYYGSDLVFTGFLQCQEFSNQWKAFPYEISFAVISPLGLLDSFKFDSKPLGMISFSALINEVADKLDANISDIVYPGNSNSPWDCKMFSTICVPFNENFKYYDSSEEIFSPQTLKYFIEGICAWRGWTVHDVPGKIVFQQFHYDNGYYSISGQSISHTDIDYNTVFRHRGTNNKQVVFPPLNKITVKANDENIHEDLNCKYSNWIGESAPINEPYTIQRLRSIDPSISGNIQETDIPGAFPCGEVETTASEVAPLNKDSWVVRYYEDLPALYLQKTFFSFRYAYGGRISAKFSYGSELQNIESFSEDQSIDICIKQGSLYLCEDGYYGPSWKPQTMWTSTPHDWHYKIKDGEPWLDHIKLTGEGVPFRNSAFTSDRDNEFEPISIQIKKPVGFSDGDYIVIDTLSLSAGDKSKYYNRIKLYETETVLNNPKGGIDEKTINVNFSNYKEMRTNTSFGTNGKMDCNIPDFSYMFNPQRILQLYSVALSNINLTRLYTDWFYGVETEGSSERFAVIADRFNLKRDEHLLLMAQIN